jgi:hypothetical protein
VTVAFNARRFLGVERDLRGRHPDRQDRNQDKQGRQQHGSAAAPLLHCASPGRLRSRTVVANILRSRRCIAAGISASSSRTPPSPDPAPSL